MRRCGRGAKDACCRSSGLAAVSGSWAEGKKYFLRVFPALTHYWDIVSDTPSGLYIGYIYIHSHSIWPSFWQMLSHSFWHSIWHTFWHLCWRSLWISLASILTFFLSSILAFSGVGTARPCPLRSGARGRGPAVPTEIWHSRLRSGSAHWHLELAVEQGGRRKEGESNSDKI